MAKCDAILFGRSQHLVFREKRERRCIEIGQQSSVERDTNEQRGHTLADRAHVVLCFRVKADGAE